MIIKTTRYKLARSLLIFFAIFFLSGLGMQKYPGSASYFILFTTLSISLLYAALNKKAIFFETFIGIYLFLGFWLKFVIRLTFFDGSFVDPVGNFDYTGGDYDRALFVASVGFLGLLSAFFLRQKYLFDYSQLASLDHVSPITKFYAHHKRIILISFVLTFLTVSFTNYILGIYQRGEISNFHLPLGFNSVYKWLLLFGFASFSAIILKAEITINKQVTLAIFFIVILECFFSSVSMLSRGMILNASVLAYGIFRYLNVKCIQITKKSITIACLLIFTLVCVSVSSVNFLRALKLTNNDANNTYNVKHVDIAVSITAPLFIDRWVGLEGVMSVSSSPKLGWTLLKSAFEERYNEKNLSFYDANLINSPYKDAYSEGHHFISLPGIIGFLFYSGSYLFLFFGIASLGVIASLFEYIAYKLSFGNLILCAVIAQVIAYRYANFGYVPGQSNLLLSAVLINLSLISFLEGAFFILKSKFLMR